jgi:CheY-like chemotaxis protein
MPEPSKNCVLLVEDDPGVRALYSSLLREAGYEVMEAQDGIDAIVKLREKLPDAIISDLEMPRMTGVELLKIVRSRFPRMPTIAISGGLDQRAEQQEIAADCLFAKGQLKVTELRQRLAALIARAAARPEAAKAAELPLQVSHNGPGLLVINCPECLRTFKISDLTGIQEGQGSTLCPHCNAQVKYRLEGWSPA